MAFFSKFTGAEIEKVIDGRYNNFKQSILGDNSIAVSANSEFLFVNNGLVANEVSAPTYITSRWSSVNSKIAFPEELDAPTYVVDMAPLFTPTSVNEGSATMRIYIDESGTRDFSTDPLIRTYNSRYKGTDLVSIVGTWFLGSSSGFDAKNNGVYFTLEFENAGTLSALYHVIYRT